MRFYLVNMYGYILFEGSREKCELEANVYGADFCTVLSEEDFTSINEK